MKRSMGMFPIFLISLLLIAPVHAAASDLAVMRVSLIRGDVQIRTEDTADWVPASINMPLREGDRIWVPEEGLAEIQAKDGSYFRLSERSALEILALERDSYQIYLTEGRLYAYYTGGRGRVLQVDTSASSVRAHERSKFKVDVPGRGPVDISVLQGEVTVESRESLMRVLSGERLSLGEGAYSEKSTLGAPDEWERWNWDRDREIAERRPPSRHLPEELQPYSSDFHDNGRWVHTPDYGYVWTPTVSVSVGWAPYRHGRWVWIGGDYVWVSYESWGWVPYHYGRWYFAASIGWCWVPPARGAVYWAPGYVGWVYTSNRVAWVPLAPHEIYYGRGHYGPHSVNITNVKVTHVHVDKVVYKNVRVHNAVTTVNHDTFVRGRPADAHVKENPFLTEKVHVGRPPIKPEKTSAMPVVREVPQAKRPPEPVRQVNVRELKEQRPMVKSKEFSVFAPEKRPREMPVRLDQTKPAQTNGERAEERRHPSKRPEPMRPAAPAERRDSQPPPTETKAQPPKEPVKPERGLERTIPPEQTPAKVQEQRQPAPVDKGRRPSTPSEPAVKAREGVRAPEPRIERSRQNTPAPPRVQEQKQLVPKDQRAHPQPSSTPAAESPKEMRRPERGTNKSMESRTAERFGLRGRPPGSVQSKQKEVHPPERVVQQSSKRKSPEKDLERAREPKSFQRGAERP